MNTAILALLGLISSTEAQQIMADSVPIDWANKQIDCKTGIDRVSLLQSNTDFTNHPKGTLYNDPSFPASKTSLYWSDYQQNES